MPEYVKKMLLRLQHKSEVTPHVSPHLHVSINYSFKYTQQYVTAPDSVPFLPSSKTKYIQSVTGNHLCYITIYYTIIPALNDISSTHSHPTQKT